MQKRAELQGKKILLGVSGSVAAIKVGALVTLLQAAQAEVKVICTPSGLKFLSEDARQSIGCDNLFSDIFADDLAQMDHIALARWADVYLLVPAGASVLSRCATGLADQLLSLTYLVTAVPVLIAPAMNQQMWRHSAVQRNAQILQADGCIFLGPASGKQACGDIGFGRMLEPEELCRELANFFQQIAQGKTVLITAGPTQEAIDPVRFLSNYSSGKMGYALAQAFVEQGAKVILVTGPTSLPLPNVDTFVNVTTADEMKAAVLKHGQTCDVVISAAAISDYKIAEVATQKIKKNKDDLLLSLTKTDDVLMCARRAFPDVFLVGFALETQDLIEHAERKMVNKDLDMIVANEFTVGNRMFNSEFNKVAVLRRNVEMVEFSLQSKKELSRELVQLIVSTP